MRFVGPEDYQIVLRALGPGPVETPQGMVVEQQLQKCVHVAAFGLKLLRHGQANDSATINVTKVKSAVGAFSINKSKNLYYRKLSISLTTCVKIVYSG